MSIEASFCMLDTPEKDKAMPGKAGIEDVEVESATPGNIIIEITDRQSEKQDTTRKEELENGGSDDYLPTPPNDSETDTQKDNQKKARREEESENDMKSIAPEQTGRTMRTEHTEKSKIEKILAAESETEKKEEKVHIQQESAEELHHQKKKMR